MDKKKFAEIIKLRRTELGLNVAQLAKVCDLSQTTIARWEEADTLPVLDKAVDLAKALDISINELVGEKEVVRFDVNKANEAIETMKEIVNAASLPNCPRDIFEGLAKFGPNDEKLWETVRRTIDVYLSLSEDEKGKKKTKRSA